MWKCSQTWFDDDMFQVQRYSRAYVRSWSSFTFTVASQGCSDCFMAVLFCFVLCFSYCARVFLPSVPLIWICEACRFSSSRVLLISGVTENQMDSETTRSLDPKISHSSGVDDDHETTMLRSNEIEEVVGSEISANVGSVIHLPLQPHTSPLGDETHLSFSLTFFSGLLLLTTCL